MKKLSLIISVFALFMLVACGNGGMDEEAPVIDGVADKAITLGEDFDPLAGITASDETDGDLTEAISVEGDYDLTEAGSYEIKLKVADEAGNETEETMMLTVNGQPLGTVSGNITYNELANPDTDSSVLLIPQGVDFNESDMSLYLMGFKTDDELGIYSTRVDSNGNYEFTGVEPGDYFIYVKSEHTENQDFLNMAIPTEFEESFSESNINTLLVDADYNKGVIEMISIESGETTDFSHDFGY